jgi:hypothetical protein
MNEDLNMSERQYSNDKARQKVRKPEKGTPDASPEINDLVRLQGVVGNQGVQRLLAQSKLVIQPKMNVTPAGDQYEQEADNVAKQVVQQINQPQAADVQRAGPEEELQMQRIQRAGEEDELQMQRIQRAGEEDELAMKRNDIQRAGEEEELQMKRIQRAGEEDELQMQRKDIQRAGPEEELQMQRIQRAGEEDELQMQRIQRAGPEEELQMQRIQRKGFEDGGEIGSDLESTIESARSGGQAMDEGVRGKLEGAFGADFSGVRVHTDAQSDTLNHSIQAKAFTTGSDIFFSKGAYDPGSPAGQELLGHELTHVVQQNGAVQKKDEQK